MTARNYSGSQVPLIPGSIRSQAAKSIHRRREGARAYQRAGDDSSHARRLGWNREPVIPWQAVAPRARRSADHRWNGDSARGWNGQYL